MVSFEDNRARANKLFSLYYESVMEWIGNNVKDVRKYSIEFPFKDEKAICGITTIKFFITIELKNSLSTCLMAEITIYDKKILDAIREDIKFRYSNDDYTISNIGNELKVDFINDYIEMLYTSKQKGSL